MSRAVTSSITMLRERFGKTKYSNEPQRSRHMFQDVFGLWASISFVDSIPRNFHVKFPFKMTRMTRSCHWPFTTFLVFNVSTLSVKFNAFLQSGMTRDKLIIIVESIYLIKRLFASLLSVVDGSNWLVSESCSANNFDAKAYFWRLESYFYPATFVVEEPRRFGNIASRNNKNREKRDFLIKDICCFETFTIRDESFIGFFIRTWKFGECCLLAADTKQALWRSSWHCGDRKYLENLFFSSFSEVFLIWIRGRNLGRNWNVENNSERNFSVDKTTYVVNDSEVWIAFKTRRNSGRRRKLSVSHLETKFSPRINDDSN